MKGIKGSLLILGLGIAAAASAVAGEKIPAAQLTVPLVAQLVHGATDLLNYIREKGVEGYFVAAAMPCCGGGDATLAWKTRYREYPGVGHNCWAPTYADWDNVLSWFFA